MRFSENWLTDIFKSGFNAVLFTDIENNVTLHTEVNKKCQLRCKLIQSLDGRVRVI